MRDPGGNHPGAYNSNPRAGANAQHPYTTPQTGPSYGSTGTPQGSPAPGYGSPRTR
jgi:hypothetical protein